MLSRSPSKDTRYTWSTRWNFIWSKRERMQPRRVSDWHRPRRATPAIPSGIADSVLLFGPLYHLVDAADRLQALREARRILKHRGILFAAAISRFASLMAGLSFGTFQDAEFRTIVATDLASGQHRNPTNQ